MKNYFQNLEFYKSILNLLTNFVLIILSIAVTLYVTDVSLGKYLQTKRDSLEKKCKDFDKQKFANSRGFSILNAYYKPNDTVQHCGKEWDYIYHINPDGFRVNGNKIINNNILAIGDSFTFGFGVQDNESFPALLGATNAGMWGNPFDIQFQAFKRDVELTRPKIILWGIYPSHIITMMPGEWSTKCPGNINYFSQNNSSIKANLVRVIVTKFIIPLKEKSNIVKYIFDKNSILKIEVNNGVVSLYTNCYSTKEKILYNIDLANNNYTSDVNINKSYLTDRTKVYNDMKNYFAQTKEIADKKDIQIYFFIIPSKFDLKLKDETYPKNIDRSSLDSDLPTSTIKTILEEVGYNTNKYFIDLSKYFEKTNNWTYYYYKDDAHWNKYGHQFVAEIFKYLLLQNKEELN